MLRIRCATSSGFTVRHAPDYAEKRQQARNIILTELIFVLIPFIFLGIVAVEDSFAGIIKTSINLAYGPELALVASLLYGQTCVKLISCQRQLEMDLATIRNAHGVGAYGVLRGLAPAALHTPKKSNRGFLV